MSPWITTRPLEQANDTKELNEAQLRLLTKVGLVNKSVDDTGMVS